MPAFAKKRIWVSLLIGRPRQEPLKRKRPCIPLNRRVQGGIIPPWRGILKGQRPFSNIPSGLARDEQEPVAAPVYGALFLQNALRPAELFKVLIH